MKNRASGFTLLEMLLALTICMVLVSLVYGGLRVGMRSWEASQQRAENGHLQRISWQFLHRALSDANRYVETREGQPRVLFEGDSRQLTFVTELPAYLSRTGLHVLRLSPRHNEPDLQLVLHYTPVTALAEEGFEAAAKTSVLVEHLDAIELRYFGRPRGVDVASWHSVWSGESQLPELIQLRIRTKDGRQWPVLTAHPEHGASRKTSLTRLMDASFGMEPEAGS